MCPLRNDLEKHVARFLEKHVCLKEPVYIAFSGGPDSTALLHVLLASGREMDLHAVHVDHGWRKESSEEARLLEAQITALKIPFHSCKLAPAPEGVNLEDWSRMERMRCFSELGAKFVFLAHHADDQIEVVMKRFLEGSSIKNLRGMRAVEEREGFTLMRPLLSFRKKELLAWLQTRNIPYLYDPTNEDPKYLRARFRTELFPFLRDSFGKEFEESLLRVSEEAFYLDEWLQESLREAFSFGEACDCAYASARKKPVPHFLVRHLIDELRKKCSLPAPSRTQVTEIVASFLGSPSGGKTFPLGRGVLLVEHGWMGAFAEKPLPIPTLVCDQKEGCIVVGCWEVSWKESVFDEVPRIAWQELFQGKPFQAMIPKKEFTISRSSDKLLGALKCKVFSPTSLRSFVPAILQEGHLVADSLTGYSASLLKGETCYKIDIHMRLLQN